jgi:hypothetical protein
MRNWGVKLQNKGPMEDKRLKTKNIWIDTKIVRLKTLSPKTTNKIVEVEIKTVKTDN